MVKNMKFTFISSILMFSLPTLAGKSDPIKLDVVNLVFKVPCDNCSKKNSFYEFGNISMDADIENNQIQKFNVEAKISRLLLKQDYHAKLKELKGKSIALKANGISAGALEGIGMNESGEGILRFTPNPKIIGKGISNKIDLTLKQVGNKKNWAVFYQNKVLKSVDFKLDKDPSNMNTFSLMLSVPKIVKMDTEFLGCDAESVASVLVDYEAPELLKLSNCNFKNSSAEEIYSIYSSVVEKFDVYKNVYEKGGDPSAMQRKFYSALESLKAFGLDYSKRIKSDLQNNTEIKDDVISKLAINGHENKLNELYSMGIVSQSTEVLEDIISKKIQYDFKSKKLVNSKAAIRIYQMIKEFVVGSPKAANVLLFKLNYSEMDGFFGGTEEDTNSGSIPENTQKLIRLMAEEGFDFTARSDDFDNSSIELIKDHTDGTEREGDLVFFNKSQGKELISLLKSVGAK